MSFRLYASRVIKSSSTVLFYNLFFLFSSTFSSASHSSSSSAFILFRDLGTLLLKGRKRVESDWWVVVACMWNSQNQTRKNLAHNYQHSSPCLDDVDECIRRRVRGMEENINFRKWCSAKSLKNWLSNVNKKWKSAQNEAET